MNVRTCLAAATVAVLLNGIAYAQITPRRPIPIPRPIPHLNLPKIHVVNESNGDVVGAEVFLNGNLAGTTGDDGILMLGSPLRVGDELIARQRVLEQSTYRNGHSQGSTQNWKYRTYITSLSVNNFGQAFPARVIDPTQEQRLQVRRDNALFGIHLVVSVEWDATPAEFELIRSELQQSSAYLYNATDGQFYFEQIELADRSAGWNVADYRIHADRDIRPHTDVPFGFWEPTWPLDPGLVHYPRGTAQPLASKYWGGPSVYIHEFGHYGFGLFDEYDDLGAAVCTAHARDTSGPFMGFTPQASCLMWDQGACTKFCSSLDLNPHNTWTIQGVFHGTSCWGQIADTYRDRNAFVRYILQTPETRHAIPGTLPPPIAAWQTRFNLDQADEPNFRAPMVVTVLDDQGRPRKDVHLWLDQGPGRPHLEEGNTDASGQLTIIGIHAGQVVRGDGVTRPVAEVPEGFLAMHGPVQKQGENTLIYSDAAPQLKMSAQLDAKQGSLIISARLLKGRASEGPSITLWDGDGKSQVVQGTFDQGSQSFRASVPLPENKRLFRLEGVQKLDDGNSIYGDSAFSINGVYKGDQAEMYSPDGGFAVGQPGKAIVPRTLVCLSEGAEMGDGSVRPVQLSFANGGNTAAFIVKFLLTGEAAKQLSGPEGDRMVILQRLANGQVVALKSVLHRDEGVIAALAEQPGTFTVGVQR